MTRSRRKALTRQRQRRKTTNEEIEVARDVSVVDAAFDRIQGFLQAYAEHDNCMQLLEDSAESATVEIGGKRDKLTLPTLKGEELWFLNGYAGPRDPLSILTHVCVDETVQSWEQFLNRFSLQKFSKIGEGAFSEVYETYSRDLSRIVLKMIPIEADELNSRTLKTLNTILPEVLIYKEMGTLSSEARFATPCFIGAQKVHMVQGKCPKLLILAWKEFATKRSYYNDSPESFTAQQYFIIFETSYGGINLERFKFKRFSQAISVFVQTTLSLAIAERMLFFEHRDLHVGNILIQTVPTRLPIE